MGRTKMEERDMNSNLTRRNFLGASAVAAAGLGLVACGGSGSDAGSATTSDATSSIASEDLVKAAKEDGALVVYGSCEEAHVAACCENFQKLFGIETQYQRHR